MRGAVTLCQVIRLSGSSRVGRGVTIHRRECPRAFDTDPERRIEVNWDVRAKINRPVQLRVTTAQQAWHFGQREPDLQRSEDQHQRSELSNQQRWACLQCFLPFLSVTLRSCAA